MKFKILLIFLAGIATSLSLSSCFHSDDPSSDNYEEWKQKNEMFINEAASETIEGRLRYEKLVPEWDTSVYALIEWLNKSETHNTGINPISTSTVKVKYVLRNIEGDTLDSSNGFKCRPENLVTGFQVALYNMTEGDSVSALIPYQAGYGAYSNGTVLPYSTLVFSIKLDSIIAYQTLPWR